MVSIPQLVLSAFLLIDFFSRITTKISVLLMLTTTLRAAHLQQRSDKMIRVG